MVRTDKPMSAMTFGMFDVLDAVQGTKQKFAER
jgi:hypothetical protein